MTDWIENTTPGSPRYGDYYYDKAAPGGVLHVYKDGTTEFVPNPPPPVVVSSTPQPITSSPPPTPVGPTGGTAAPAPAPAPAPAAPNPPPTVVGSTPQPTTGGGANIPPAPAWNPSDPTVYENPTTHDLYQVDDASAKGQWHVYQTHAEWVAAPPGESGWDITNVTPAQYAAEQPQPPTVVGSTPQPTTGSGGSPPTVGVTGGTPAPSDPSTPTPISSTPQPTTSSPSPTSSDPTGGTAAPAADSSGTSGDTGGTPAPVASSATYTVVHGDTLSGIAASNGMSTSQLEALNPQINNPNVIEPGQTVNLGSGSDSSTSTTPPTGGATYTVVHGDTMWGIAQSNNISLSQLEALNPQIKDPDLIFPGQNVNLGGGGSTDSSSASSSSTPAASPAPSVTSGTPYTGSTTPVSANSGDSQSLGSNSDSGATDTIGFPGKSSYPSIGSEVEKVANDVNSEAKSQGWEDGSGSGTSDIAKGVFEVDNHTSTDPLKIDDKK